MDTTAVQRALVALGYALEIDGVAGPKTRAALQAFQRGRGLAADGIVGPQTIKALQAAGAEKSEPRTAPDLLSEAVIRAVAPSARQDIVAVIVGGADQFAATGIVRPLRMAHFLAQIATETGGLKLLEESLNYSPDGLMKTFSRTRISASDCQALGRIAGRPAQQEKIGNLIYGGEWGRKNLGNTQPGDGWRYRGGGMMQTTGRANYRRAGFEDNPEALRSPAGGLAAALKFWADNGLNTVADSGSVAAVRKIVNGGANGLDEAEAYFAKARKALAA